MCFLVIEFRLCRATRELIRVRIPFLFFARTNIFPFPFPLPFPPLSSFDISYDFVFFFACFFYLAVCTRNLSRYTISVWGADACRGWGAWSGEPSRGCDCFIFIWGLTWQPWQPSCLSNSHVTPRDEGSGGARLVPS